MLCVYKAQQIEKVGNHHNFTPFLYTKDFVIVSISYFHINNPPLMMKTTSNI